MVDSCTQSIDFFMGALSPTGGFRGYFSQLNQQPDLWLYLIKAGPGCGKSTMMQSLAKKSNFPVEKIHCSSDPDSLDGVVFHNNHCAIIDATAPHVVEPTYPGAKQTVVSLFDTLDPDILYQNRNEIISLFDQCSLLQKNANRSLRCASLLLEEIQDISSHALDTEKLSNYIHRLAHRLLPPTHQTGKEHLRLLSAVTPQGNLFWKNTVSTLATHYLVFEDSFGSASRLAIQLLRQSALKAGYEIYTCICPLSQPEAAEHLIIPQLKLAFLTSNRWHSMDFAGQQRVHCNRFMNKKELSNHKNRFRLSQQTAIELLYQTSLYQQQAKSHHDKLEAFYQSAANFEAVSDITNQIAKQMAL